MARDNDVDIVKSSLDNGHQRRDVIHSVYHQIIRHDQYKGRLGYFVYELACVPYSWAWRDIDRRWKEHKALDAARDEMLEAIRRYDDAVHALNVRAGLIKE